MQITKVVTALLLLCAISVAAQQRGASAPAQRTTPPASTSPQSSASSKARPTRPAAGKAPARQCAAQATTLCASFPANWTRVGDVYDGLGFVVAEPNAATKKELWNSITVSLVPADGTADEAPVAADIMDQALQRPGANQATLRRWRETVAGNDVELARIRVSAPEGERIEQIAFAQQGEYIVACVLNSTAQEADRLNALWLQVIGTLRAPTASNDQSEPAQDPGLKPPAKQPASNQSSPK